MKAKDLKQDKRNYRKHSDRNKELIRKSVTECGLGRSVLVDADGVLIAGNGVASSIDKDTPVRVVETDGSELVVVKRTDLHTDDAKRRLLALADNATSDSSEWDVDTLTADWGEVELKEWDVDVHAVVEELSATEDDFDEDTDEVETKVKRGELWQCGEHRLMCGDSTNADDVSALMGGGWLTL